MHGTEFVQDLAIVMLIAGLVGWLCHRVGLSVVVGYLAAGMVIGPYTPPFSLVSNAGRIETLAQVGLVFLMFSIGMKLSLRKLRRLGLSLVVATFVGAFLMYSIARAVGAGLGWPPVQTVFLAAMLMVSSSAIISKVLQDLGATHEKAGQLAMGVSVLEDIVAVVMLAILNSLISASGAPEAMGETVGLLGGFIVLASVGGLLLVPWVLKKLTLTADAELMTIMTAGLLFMLAILAQRAGFSLALGAFLLGAIVAETPHRTQVDRAFEGMRDVFSAVFFVAIGMMINLKAAAHLWWLVLLLAVVALLGRTLAVSVGLMVTGAATRDAVRVGVSATALGEFSFIIAQLGIAAGVMVPEFQAVAVGVSLLTTLAAPVLMRRAPRLGEWIEGRQPKWLEDWLGYYRQWLERLMARQKKNLLWQLSRRRLIQIFVEMLLVTGLLSFAESLLDAALPWIPGEKLFPSAPRVIFWSGLAVVVLAPLIAIWRNVSALALLYSEVTTAGQANVAKLRPMVETGLKVVAGIVLFVWLSAVMPIGVMGRWVPVVAVLLAAAVVVFARQKLVYWHSVVETELQDRIVQNDEKFTGTAAPWLAQHSEWHLGLTECVLPDQADVRGRTLGELALRARFGVVVAGIERQGVMVGNPSPDTALYPRDKILLLGDPKQTAAGKAFLLGVAGEQAFSHFDEVRMETCELPLDSKLAGRTLAELAPTRHCGVQVAGIHRGGLRILNPGGDEKLLPRDDVLVLGSPDQIAAFKAWAREGTA
ncbi:cation:proton antiporter [Oleiharenicola sp. Vm1]|uniref:cation:proton antiporter domain-containing protein n=1 Tax=Oleiharenicola sp. Vm1 TaxID=3398393 RepID=UPI0039F44DD3